MRIVYKHPDGSFDFIDAAAVLHEVNSKIKTVIFPDLTEKQYPNEEIIVLPF